MVIATLSTAWIILMDRGWVTYGELLTMGFEDFARLWKAGNASKLFDEN
jgi:hypothetical protein